MLTKKMPTVKYSYRSEANIKVEAYVKTKQRKCMKCNAEKLQAKQAPHGNISGMVLVERMLCAHLQ